MDKNKSMANVYEDFFDFSRKLASKVPKDDPNVELTLKYVDENDRIEKVGGENSKEDFGIF